LALGDFSYHKDLRAPEDVGPHTWVPQDETLKSRHCGIDAWYGGSLGGDIEAASG
jgi:hypothetical protein